MMSDSTAGRPSGPRRRLRWWPAGLILLVCAGAVVWIRLDAGASFQQRNLRTLGALLVTVLLLLLWWLTWSRARWKLRLGGLALLAAGVALSASVLRIQGVTGDLLPIVEWRWSRSSSTPGVAPAPPEALSAERPPISADRSDFPQFLGPDRNAVLDGPLLSLDWGGRPPQVLWRQAVGAGWSGWAIVGGRALTQEQLPEGEAVTCYELETGRRVWAHTDPAHYHTTIAGEGPRCTPTVVSNRVFALGATGILNALDLATGRRLWSRNIADDAQARVPEWGFAGSPLVFDGKVVVLAGGASDRSLIAYRFDSGERAWSGGSAPASYGSPSLAELAGIRQILAFHPRSVTGQEADSGRVLWEHAWGVGQPQVAAPMVVGSNRVLFSSGYGVGSVLLELRPDRDGQLSATRVWQSNRLKAKFATLVQREGFAYGLDDGILACLDLRDGSQRWKEGRYGHGQGLLVRDRLLLMSEGGELVLLQPAPDAPNERARFRVFNSKTWNPIALAGDRLLVRNDREAAGLRLSLSRPAGGASSASPPNAGPLEGVAGLRPSQPVHGPQAAPEGSAGLP